MTETGLTPPGLQPQPGRTGRSRSRSVVWRRFVKPLLWIVLLLLVASAAYAAYLYFFKLDPMLDRIGTDQTVASADQASRKPYALLLLGLDTRPETGSLNTDVIMVAALNPQRKSAVVVSVPRDTYVKAAKGLPAGKANAWYAAATKGGKTSGEAVKSAFGAWLNIPIAYMATIDFRGFEDVVDALGGVRANVDMAMRYVDKADGTNIDLQPGEQKLSGKQALDFVRYRKSNQGTAESSDLERNSRQQAIVSAIIGKLQSASGIMRLGGVIDAAGDNVETDIPKSQLVSFLKTYAGISGDNIQYIHLGGDWRSPYIYVPAGELAEAQKALAATLK
ncbi:MAG: LCP family protein [Paenibacillaceae bacterium]|nr:LCP family protein [Paenibacillaceae bacterium]